MANEHYDAWFKKNFIDEAKAAINSRSTEDSGGSADDRVKYVTYMDRGTELLKYPVIEGDTARDPVAKGYIEKPTKEPTTTTVYTQDGWSKTDGGAPDSTALQNVTDDRTVYAAFTESARLYTIRFYNGDTLVHTEQVDYLGSSSYKYDGTKDGYIYGGWLPAPENITSDMDCYAQWEEILSLATMSWAKIAEISANGQAENYFAIGDAKAVAIKGTVGTIAVDDTYYVYIIGFNHNSELEGTGIHFGTFKNADGVDVALCDSKHAQSLTDGTKLFNFNHWGNFSYGGWSGSDLRYDVLGSTDVAPSGYGAAVSVGRKGYDATETCATNPVANTLMAALPTELRVVMKPMTIYTDNVGGNTTNETNITKSIDYLPLLSRFEVSGATNMYTTSEENYQEQYAYYSAGNSMNKYSHSSDTTEIQWSLRSPLTINQAFNHIKKGSVGAPASYSNGLAPIFKV